MEESGELLPMLHEEIEVHELRVERLRGALRPLVRYLRLRRPAAMVANMWPLTSIAVWAAKLARSESLIITADHGVLSMSSQAQGWMRRLLMQLAMILSYRWAEAVVAVSRGVADDISSLALIPRNSITVIHNPVADVRSPSDEVPHDLASWLETKPRVLTVGSLKPEKDHLTLLEAFSRFGAQSSGLLILGEGPLRDSTSRRVNELGLESRVWMPGFVADPRSCYEAADLFVLSSTSEGFGNVLVEALQAGLPIVSTDCPAGPREILDSGRYGALVPVGDSDALSAAMTRALQRPPDSERQRMRAREFSIESGVEEWLGLLNRRVGRGPRGVTSHG